MATARMTKKPTAKATDTVEVTETAENTAVTTDFSSVGKPVTPKTARVRIARDHDCCIGGKHYHFEAGKVYDVPLGVKNILIKGDLLRPIR